MRNEKNIQTGTIGRITRHPFKEEALRVELAQSNIIYRRPDLAEGCRQPTAVAHAQRWIDLIEHYHRNARSVLELGCWIGLDAEQLARHYRVVGVDIQPRLIDYARTRRPSLDLRLGDLTTIRLGRTFDVLLCVGNTMSYVHDDRGLNAAFATFTAHAHCSSLLIMHTLLAPISDRDPATPHRLDAGGLRASYTDRNDWCPLTHLLTTLRTWRHDDGRTEIDLMRRRVLPAPELDLRARLAGWDVLSVSMDPPELAVGGNTGASGCLVARYRGPDTDRDGLR